MDMELRRRRWIYAVIKRIGIYVEYDLEFLGSETDEHVLVMGCDDRSMRQTTRWYPLMNILCCNERTICCVIFRLGPARLLFSLQ